MIESKVGVDEKAAAKQLPKARALAEQFPQSVPVLLAAAEVEFDNKNYAEAEALSNKALAIDPKSTEAAINLANTSLMRSLDDKAMMAQARERFIAANNMENDHPVPLYGYYLTYLLSGEEAPDSAKNALEGAYQYAPFDTGIRQALTHMFLLEGELGIAKSLLNPLIQTGHGTRVARCLAYELDLFEKGDKEPLLKRLKPKHPAADEKKEEPKDDAEPAAEGETTTGADCGDSTETA